MFCCRALHTELVQDLLALIGDTRGASREERERWLRARLDAAGLGATVSEMSAVVDRAIQTRASDEELALALGVVIALSRVSRDERAR